MARMTENARRALVEDRQTQLLGAAARVFAKKGYERATIKDIAKQAGVSEGSIYNYFKNKNELLISILGQAVAHPAVELVSAEVLRENAGKPLPPDKVLTQIARAILKTFQENGPIFRILISALPTVSQAQREKYVDEVIDVAAGALETFFTAEIQQGVFRADLNPALAARSFFGLVLPFVLLQDILQLQARAFDYEQVIAHAVRLFLNGALAKPAGGKRP